MALLTSAAVACPLVLDELNVTGAGDDGGVELAIADERGGGESTNE